MKTKTLTFPNKHLYPYTTRSGFKVTPSMYEANCLKHGKDDSIKFPYDPEYIRLDFDMNAEFYDKSWAELPIKEDEFNF